METKTSLTRITLASLGRRVLSWIMDGALFAFTWLGLVALPMLAIADNAFDYSKKMALGQQYQVASHLYVYCQSNADGDMVPLEVKDFDKLDADKQSQVITLYNYESDDYTFYLKRLYYYYHDYKVGRNIEMPGDKFDPQQDHFEPPTEYLISDYTNQQFSNDILDITNENTYFVIDTSIDNYVESIKLKDSSEENYKNVIKYLKQKSNKACEDFYYSSYYSNIMNNIKGIQLFMVLPPFAISYGIYFVMLPLLLKDGQTLGKKTLNIAVISTQNYTVKKRQILFRELILFVYIGLSTFVIGIGLTSLATLGVGILLLFLATLISKEHRSPHDYAAMTKVVDVKHSTWFDSQEAENKANLAFDEKMQKYHRNLDKYKNETSN